MKKRVLLIALMTCTYAAGFAQVDETAKEMGESQHQRFALELPGALEAGRAKIFGLAVEKKQFFLENDPNTFAEFLGWNEKKIRQSTLHNVFTALSEKTIPHVRKNQNPVIVTIDFPEKPSETTVSLKTDSKGTTARYTVTTKVNVMVEAQKEGVRASVARNNVALSWEGKLPLVNGELNGRKKISQPVLRSVKITEIIDMPEPVATAAVTTPSRSDQQLRNMATDLIEKYYTYLKPPINRDALLAPEIPNRAEFEQWLKNSTKIDIASGSVTVPLPDNDQFIEVKTVPRVTIHVDPAPYMPESSSLYASKEAYHQLSLTFTVDLEAEKIARVAFTDDFIRPVLAPKPEIHVAEQPVESKPAPTQVAQKVSPVAHPEGLNYKVQILMLDVHKPIAELPRALRVEGLVVEKYPTGYKYVVPAGTTLREALAKQRQLIASGVEETWIVVYDNETRSNPFGGKPEYVE